MTSRFIAKLYLRDESGFSEERTVSAAGIVSEELQLLRFQLLANTIGLRLDPAEQPGFMQLDELRLRRDGQLVWQWQSARDGWSAFAACSHHQLVFGEPADPAGLLLLCGADPWLELPIAPALLHGGAELELEAQLRWLISERSLSFPGAVHLAQQGLALQAEHARLLAEQARQAHNLYLQSETELRQVTSANSSALQRLAAVQGLHTSVQPLAATVDVIVPVYLNLEETRRCIEAVMSCAVRTPWRLVLVNDCSPQQELTQWLRKLAASDARVILVENSENLGYSGSVNRGIGLSDEHDVVLLNSDAEVANDWLDRLRAAAYCDARVCSVTPFTNNGTICSYPNFCQPNALPDGCTVAQVDRAFASANAGRVLDIPTAVGFCMYTRRDCLQEIGLFDMNRFGKGYGEENDFCLRAAGAGWRNLHALDVFVQHTGGVSFGESKPQRELDAMQTLRHFYPDYERKVHDYIRSDPPAAARQRAGQALASLVPVRASDKTPHLLFRPFFRTEEVLAEIRGCLDSGWTGPGPKTAEFESRWCKYTGLPHTHFLNSATAGLHLSLTVLKEHDGWQDGDEVISTPLTFVSTNHAILYCGLKPVFADVDEYLTLDPRAVERCITPRTRAVMYVGLGGNAGRWEEIQALCRARGLRLVLDAAHMSGTRLRGRHAGYGADAAVFSFHAVKNLPTADAGALCFADKALDARARSFSWLGVDRDTYSRTSQGGTYRWQYEVPVVGFKYHGNSVVAAMALVGLRHLEEDNARRRELAAVYDTLIGEWVERVPVAPDCESSRHLYQILVDDRASVIEKLAASAVQCGVHYRDNTCYPMYSGQVCYAARRASERVLSLPLHVGMSNEDVGEICRALKSAVMWPEGQAPPRPRTCTLS